MTDPTIQHIETDLTAIQAAIAGLPARSIAVINASTLVTDAQLAPVVAALQIQISRDFAPIWGINAKLHQIPQGQQALPTDWWLTILDTSDQAGALGYHDVTATGNPLGKVFVQTTIDAGDHWSVTASHELMEMLADPEINLTVFNQSTNTAGRLWAMEVGDPVEDDSFGYTINGVLVSDFIVPAWFGTGSTGPFDLKGHVTAPFQILLNGYMGYFDVGSGSGWQQLTDRSVKGLIKSRAPVGSRRERRRIPRHQWVKSVPILGRHHGSTGEVLDLLRAISGKQDAVMSDLTDLQAKFASLVAAVTQEDSDINTAIAEGQAAASALKAQIAALQAQVAAGSAASPADLQALSAQADTLLASITAADTAVNAAAKGLPPLPAPAPAPTAKKQTDYSS